MYNFKKYNNINKNLLQNNNIIDKYINFNTILSFNISFNIINIMIQQYYMKYTMYNIIVYNMVYMQDLL